MHLELECWFLNGSLGNRSIGVSNFDVELLQKLVKIAKIKPAVNQVRAYIVIIGAIGLHGAQILFHPYNYAQNKELLEYSAKHGIITEAYSSLA